MKPPELDAEEKKCLDEVFERAVKAGLEEDDDGSMFQNLAMEIIAEMAPNPLWEDDPGMIFELYLAERSEEYAKRIN